MVFSRQDPQNYGVHLAMIIDWSLPLTILLSIGVVVPKICTDFFVSRGAPKKQIKASLNAFSDSFFKEVAISDRYKNRVTLFKAKKDFFGRQSLIIFARAGTIQQKSNTQFLIDDNNEEKNEGVAGRAWYTNSRVTVSSLPQWNEGVSWKSDQNCIEYAKQSFLTLEKASQLTIKSRSITATIVRNQQGDPWGVLVLDSREPQGVENTTEKNNLIDMVANTLSSSIE